MNNFSLLSLVPHLEAVERLCRNVVGADDETVGRCREHVLKLAALYPRAFSSKPTIYLPAPAKGGAA
ncbi:MAG: hypothetical protein RBU21_07420 [FCB group bacterium]|jgi:hypothetical protein|nr:hypothetical protein [FCB group bacterium]